MINGNGRAALGVQPTPGIRAAAHAGLPAAGRRSTETRESNARRAPTSASQSWPSSSLFIGLSYVSRSLYPACW